MLALVISQLVLIPLVILMAGAGNVPLFILMALCWIISFAALFLLVTDKVIGAFYRLR